MRTNAGKSARSPVTVRIGDRGMIAECGVGPPSSEPLIGQTVLEAMDLVADCRNQTLGPPGVAGPSAAEDEVSRAVPAEASPMPDAPHPSVTLAVRNGGDGDADRQLAGTRQNGEFDLYRRLLIRFALELDTQEGILDGRVKRYVAAVAGWKTKGGLGGDDAFRLVEDTCIFVDDEDVPCHPLTHYGRTFLEAPGLRNGGVGLTRSMSSKNRRYIPNKRTCSGHSTYVHLTVSRW